MKETQTVGIITLPRFNEIDSFVAARMIGSVPGLGVELVGPFDTAVSMAGIEVMTPGRWDELSSYAAVVIGSGSQTFEHVENASMMDAIRLNLSDDQLVASQCSGAAILHRIGRLGEQAVCTDRLTAPKLEEIGVTVSLSAFRAEGRTASSGGCLASAYLAYWIIERLAGRAAADVGLSKVTPVGEELDYQARVDRLIPSLLVSSALGDE